MKNPDDLLPYEEAHKYVHLTSSDFDVMATVMGALTDIMIFLNGRTYFKKEDLQEWCDDIEDFKFELDRYGFSSKTDLPYYDK